VAQLVAVADVAAAARAGRPPEQSLLFLATSSEEVGSDLGTRRILVEHPDLVARMAVVLTEGGVVEAIGPTDVKYWGIEFAQKRYASFEICAGERERLEAIRRELLASPQGDPHPRLPDPVRKFLAAWGPTRSAAMFRWRLSNAEALALDAPRFAELTPFMKSLYRDEVYPFQVRAAPGGGFVMKVFLHLLPASDAADVARRLVPEALTWGTLRSPLVELGAEAESPTSHPVFARLESLTRAHFPRAPVGPYFLPWAATDARYFRGAGIPTYGYSPFPLVVTDTMNIGAPDERMQLPAYLEGVRLYREVVAHIVSDEFSTGD
jgi:acetylornithine deacetylase/succinyl-diaminopimelate desuccinylase-like protein